MNGLTIKEQELLRKLNAKKRAASRHEINFWKEVDARKDEIAVHFANKAVEELRATQQNDEQAETKNEMKD